ALLDRIRGRLAKVGIIGLGYVGLPLARTFALAGFPVLGFDIDPDKVDRLHQGQSYLKHIPAQDVRDMLTRGFEATSDFDRLAEADCVLLCVPPPLPEAREPDLTYVVRSARAVSQALRAGQLVVLESTTSPGTTREVVLPILEESRLKVGKDFFLAFSP